MKINKETETLFAIVTFPDIQYYMSHPDFNKHCHLVNSFEGYKKYGDSAYFVDVDWANSEEVINYIKNN